MHSPPTPDLAVSAELQARLAAVPDAAPPYDCQAHGLACQPHADPPEADLRDPVAVAVTAACDGPGSGNTDPALAWPRQFAQAIVETVAGTRPFRQVMPSTTERVQARIRQLIPLFRTETGARIRRILASRTNPDVVEVTAVAGFGPRTRALALRFEQIPARPAAPGLPPKPARWLCTDIETA